MILGLIPRHVDPRLKLSFPFVGFFMSSTRRVVMEVILRKWKLAVPHLVFLPVAQTTFISVVWCPAFAVN